MENVDEAKSIFVERGISDGLFPTKNKQIFIMIRGFNLLILHL